MFRIKTDIRQFNCETQEKVEKLIRNWVIRPTDLMLDEAAQTWSPIGEHEDFAMLFEQLREGSDVDLVESSESESSNLDGITSGTATAQILSGHGKLKLRALAQEESEPLPIPVAPEGVEPVVAADEPTIMTERTADLLGVLEDEAEQKGEEAEGQEDEESAEPLPIPVAPEGVEQVAASEEATQIFERDDEDSEQEDYDLEEVEPGEGDTAADEESEPRLGRHDLPEELFLTNEISRSELISPLEPMMDDLRNAESSVADDEETEAWEEVTQQIESPLEASEHRDEEDLPLPDEPAEGLDVALSEAAESDIHSEWENMMELDELRETDEFNVAEHLGGASSSNASEEPEEDIRETIELDSPVNLSEVSEQEVAKAPGGVSDKVIVDFSDEEDADSKDGLEASSASEPVEDAIGLDDTADFHTDDIFNSDTAPPPSLDEDALDETLDEFPAPTLDPAESNEPISDITDEVTDVPVEAPHIAAEDFVSEGYAIPLPFAITPSSEDLSQGVRRSTASESEKDMIFPRPRPKKLGELITQRYGYGDAPRVQSTGSSTPKPSEPPPDYSRIVAVVALILVVLIIASLIVIFD